MQKLCGEALAMTSFVLGTAGHVDHGKTALVRALTGTETDRWKEEKDRGLSLDIGFARLPLGSDAEVGVVDVPGHEDLVKNMLAGSTGIDLLLLVVAADEGPMPQTREHLSIARLLGVERGVVALNKIDRVDDELRDLAAQTVRDELKTVLGHAEWKLIPVSAATGEGVEDLRHELARAAGEVRPRDADDLFRMPVDRSFTVHGAGTVVTGTAWSGTATVGDHVRLFPPPARAARRRGPGQARAASSRAATPDRSTAVRIRSIEVHGRAREHAHAGRRCALALAGVSPHAAGRGSVVVKGEAWRAVARLGVRLRLLEHSPRRIERGQRVRVYLGTSEVMAAVRLRDPGRMEPGTAAWAVLELEAELLARVRDRLLVRFYSPVTTIGGGEVAELDPPRRWEERTDLWSQVLGPAPAASRRAAIELGGGRGVRIADMPLVTGLSPALAAPEANSARKADSTREPDPAPVVPIGERWFAAQRLQKAREAVLSTLAELHAAERRSSAASLEALRSSLGARFAPELLERALQELERGGHIRVEGPSVRLPGHRARLTDRELAASRTLLHLIRNSGLEPPAVETLATRSGIERGLLDDLLRLTAEREQIVALTPDLYVSAEAAAEVRLRARELFASPERKDTLGPGVFKEAFGVSRRYLIPILEYLDREGITRRTPDGRVLAESREL